MSINGNKKIKNTLKKIGKIKKYWKENNKILKNERKSKSKENEKPIKENGGKLHTKTKLRNSIEINKKQTQKKKQKNPW